MKKKNIYILFFLLLVLVESAYRESFYFLCSGLWWQDWFDSHNKILLLGANVCWIYGFGVFF